MKFRQYIDKAGDGKGFFPALDLRWVIRKNSSHTAREEAIAASVIQQANPRENISGHFPWGPEEQMVLQQLWIPHWESEKVEWRDVPVEGAAKLYSTVETEHGPLNVPNSVKEPGVVQGDFSQRLRETLGEDF